MDIPEAVRRLKQKDISALEILVNHFQKTAIEIAAYTTQDKALAEDVVSESFLLVYDRINTFDETRPFGPWFFRIVANQALKAIYKQDRFLSIEDISSVGHWLEQIPDPQQDSSHHPIELEELKQAVRSALDQLTPKQRAVIVLRYYLGFSETEIAERLEIPKGTVKSRGFGAFVRLRKLIPQQNLRIIDGISKKERS